MRQVHTGIEFPRFGVTLQTARRQAGLTQEQLSTASGISVRAIRDLELGRAHRPRRETIRLLADALGLSGSHRVLLESGSGHDAADSTVRQMYEEQLASPPAATSPLIGRERELDVVAGALLTGQERLLSLVGLPGVGKSRLALAVARRYEAEREARVLWLPVSSSPTGLPPSGPAPEPDRAQALLTSWTLDRLAGRGPLEDLVRLIGGRRTLLVLDGYEDAAVDRDSLLRLLAGCDGLQVLVTARAPLPVLGVRAVPLAALPVGLSAGGPDGGGERAAGAAVRLMASHVRYTRPALRQTAAVTEAIAGLCRQLDGVPLALNTAAGWLPMYAPEQLLAVARDNPLHLVEPVFSGDFFPGEPCAGPMGEPDLGMLIRGTVSGLRPGPARLLAVLARRNGACPTDEVLSLAGGSPGDVTRSLRGLLLRGLIREERLPEGGTAVSVLNLVRYVLRPACEPAPLTAVGRT
ncbi:helix-turn-helix domain-containing protein [Streptomyces sp. NPDC018321]|uniref:helix-turn-helix domain-containing protein n=1 Tax=unclassified Streptomyces TaxID=2593676 RepID=UPI00378CB6D0